ncbi:MAG: S41 family peptidase [Pseudomonadales bacterium]|jgi:carboxyl-terminal processing protease
MQLRPLTLIGIILSMVSGISLGISGYHVWLDYQDESPEAQAFDEVLNQVHASYVDEVDRRELVSSALRGMLGGLDDHSNYLDERDYENLQAETDGHFGGIGIELGLVEDHFTVISPLDDTPASRAGLKPGDRIIALDGEPLAGRKLIEVIDDLRGEPGSKVGLTLTRSDAEEPFTVDLTRADIAVASVRGELLEPGYGYIRISQFQANTGEEFGDVLDSLVDQNDGSLEGLVLDLRNNPGGVLQASVTVADAFLTDGLIVYTEGRLPSSHLRYRASGRDALNGKPLVVLINSGSASAAEIVAGALQDHHRARLLGGRSYGKGSVQSVMPLSGHRALKLTTAYYYTPSGRNIHHKGIEPDVAFEETNDNDEALMTEALALLKSSEPSEGLHARL